MPTLEREVEAYLRTRVEQAGGLCVKFLPDLMRGMPDRVVILPGGVLVWVETKKPKGGRVSEIQEFRHRTLRALGQAVEVCWTKEDADRIVARYRKEDEA